MTAVRNFCSAPFFYECAIQPYEEGIRRLELFWNGVDAHSLLREPLSLKDRMISLATGIPLMIPMANMIIWIFWQTFGNPEILSDGLTGKGEEPYTLPTLPPLPPIVLSIPPKPGKSAQETHTYSEKTEGGATRTVEWTIIHLPSGLIETSKETKEGDRVVVTSRGLFNPDWKGMTSYEYTEGTTHVTCTREGNKVQAVGFHDGSPIDRTFVLEENLPWFQQTTHAFEAFAQAKDPPPLRYYLLVVHNLFSGVMEMEATKEGATITLKPANPLLQWLGSSTLTFNAKGHLTTMLSEVKGFPKFTTTRS